MCVCECGTSNRELLVQALVFLKNCVLLKTKHIIIDYKIHRKLLFFFLFVRLLWFAENSPPPPHSTECLELPVYRIVSSVQGRRGGVTEDIDLERLRGYVARPPRNDKLNGTARNARLERQIVILTRYIGVRGSLFFVLSSSI